MVPTRYAKANNPYESDYDRERENNCLLYLDCTNLYGTAMRQPLPHSGFRWLEREEIDALDLSTVGAKDEIGYILDVDLGYSRGYTTYIRTTRWGRNAEKSANTNFPRTANVSGI